MKKCIILFFSLSFVAFLVCLFSGCSSSVEDNRDSISDLRYGVFDAQCESYSVTFTYGIRENPYILDGKSNNSVEFGIISVIFAERIGENETISFNLQINDRTLSGTLDKSPYTNEYMADIAEICNDEDSLTLSISLSSDDSAQNDRVVQLTNKNTSWAIDYETAFTNGMTALSDELKTIVANKETYEIYVKILTEQEGNFGTYFWNVSIISSQNTKHSVVFSVNSPEILVKN